MRATPEDLGLSAARLYKLDHLAKSYIDAGKLPGSICLVARHGRIAHLSCLGKMDIEADKDMAENTLFRVYSMTKPVTSVALMMLYEDGRFQLDYPVSDYIPAFADLRVYREDGDHARLERPITFRDLLTHTAGFTYGFLNDNPVSKLYLEHGVDEASSLEDLVEKVSELPLRFQPGSKWGYSVATDICGYLVEKIADMPLEDFFSEQIFEPLGMNDTGFSVPATQVHRFAANYSRTPDDGMRLEDSPESSRFLRPPGLVSGGGGLISSVHDYYRFAQMLLNGGELDGARLLGRKTLDLMTSNHLPNNGDLPSMGQPVFSGQPFRGIGFGLGFSVMNNPVTAQILGSAGEFAWGGAASTFFFVDPDEDLLAIFLTQLMPSSSYPLRRELRVLTYQALID